MSNFKKGFMTTLGVLAGLWVYVGVVNLFVDKDDKNKTTDDNKVEETEPKVMLL